MKKLIKKFKKLFLIVLCVLVALCIFQWYEQSQDRCSITKTTFTENSLPKQFNGFTIGYLSDLNLSEKNDLTRLNSIIQDLNAKKLDMILFGGDIFNESSFENNQVSKVLKKLQSHYGKFAVLGDKDQNDSSTCSNILTEAGFEVLHNEVRNIYYKEDIIQLIGLENTGDCSGLINETNEKSYKISLIHQPDYFKEISQYSIQLQLSGHTLGGYYKIPFIGGIETKDKGKNYVNGKHTKNKTTLLISNGFNKESSENHRFLTRDEVNIITLKR